MPDFIQLEPRSNVYEAETMVEGTLDGFLYDSEGEGDELQNEDAEEQSHGKTKRKAEKSYINVRKKVVKTPAGKLPKKAKKKSQAPKKKKGKK